MNLERIKAVFAEAAGLASPEARARYLNQACAGDPTLRAEVEAMLAAEIEAGSFLESPILGPDGPEINERIGAWIGPYRLLEFRPGEESLEVALYEEAQVPWKEIAFRTVGLTLKHWFADRQAGAFGFHAEDVAPR